MESNKSAIIQLLEMIEQRGYKQEGGESSEGYFPHRCGNFCLSIHSKEDEASIQLYVFKTEVKEYFGKPENAEVAHRIDTNEPRDAFIRKISLENFSPVECKRILDEIDEVSSKIQKALEEDSKTILVDNYRITMGI